MAGIALLLSGIGAGRCAPASGGHRVVGMCSAVEVVAEALDAFKCGRYEAALSLAGDVPRRLGW